MTQTPTLTTDYRNMFKTPFADDRQLVPVEVFIAFEEARNKALHEDGNNHIGAIIGGLQSVILELSRTPVTKQAPTRLDARGAAGVLLECRACDMTEWTDGVWPDIAMYDALRAIENAGGATL